MTSSHMLFQEKLTRQLTRWWYKDSPPDNPPEFFFHLSNVLFHAINAIVQDHQKTQT